MSWEWAMTMHAMRPPHWTLTNCGPVCVSLAATGAPLRRRLWPVRAARGKNGTRAAKRRDCQFALSQSA